MIPFIEHSQKAKIADIEDKRGDARGYEWGTGGGGYGSKESERNPSGDGNVCYLDCIDVGMSVHRSSERCYPDGKLGKGFRDLSVLGLATACQSTIVST